MPNLEADETRWWSVKITPSEGETFPDVPARSRGYSRRARPGLRPEVVRLTVSVTPSGTSKPGELYASVPTLYGRNVKQDGSLGAKSQLNLWDADEAPWAAELVRRALQLVADTAEPRMTIAGS